MPGLFVCAAGKMRAMSQAMESGYAPVEGTEFYYEVHGRGAPLVMMHGGVNPSGLFGEPKV